MACLPCTLLAVYSNMTAVNTAGTVFHTKSVSVPFHFRFLTMPWRTMIRSVYLACSTKRRIYYKGPHYLSKACLLLKRLSFTISLLINKISHNLPFASLYTSTITQYTIVICSSANTGAAPSVRSPNMLMLLTGTASLVSMTLVSNYIQTQPDM